MIYIYFYIIVSKPNWSKKSNCLKRTACERRANTIT